MRLVIIGFGTVGTGLAALLRDRAAYLAGRYDFTPQIVGVATRSRGTLYAPDGLDIDALLAAHQGGSLRDYQGAASRDLDPLRLVGEAEADVVIEASHSNFDTAQPALDHCRAALRTGKHLVLANKGPVALALTELHNLARENGRQVRYEATVMAGTPALRLAEVGLAGCTISAARGILNGTTNYILEQMTGGLAYADALADAQRLGYAEADPAADVEGWDAAGKAIILARTLFDVPLTLADLQVKGIIAITPADIEAAAAAGERWKLIAEVSPSGGSVMPVRLPLADPLANVGGAINAITYRTDLMADVTLIGPGAGQVPTAAGLLSDMLSLLQS
jgi:homoserine dehydrogenase